MPLYLNFLIKNFNFCAAKPGRIAKSYDNLSSASDSLAGSRLVFVAKFVRM
ncbi:hypothetical protein Dfer_1769 [Dyadobacter fermentans DSM 18053]|uniref:Uncharacterized protein n=1 Tax=Dyadobacter fermentans (strain ATCC 700827 / DSM 18053 / CIP 107007 / KCTC 52180 / NS114) TaxID=471854 RepID=C6VTR7_DYAFD|nr:hypothetical protein Dfer_1769 [Dyadobacter fermentans DSM 18053]